MNQLHYLCNDGVLRDIEEVGHLPFAIPFPHFFCFILLPLLYFCFLLAPLYLCATEKISHFYFFLCPLHLFIQKAPPCCFAFVIYLILFHVLIRSTYKINWGRAPPSLGIRHCFWGLSFSHCVESFELSPSTGYIILRVDCLFAFRVNNQNAFH